MYASRETVVECVKSNRMIHMLSADVTVLGANKQTNVKLYSLPALSQGCTMLYASDTAPAVLPAVTGFSFILSFVTTTDRFLLHCMRSG